MDIRLTADGVPIIMHDATVNRTTDGRGMVADLPVAAVEDLDAGCGEPVPRLIEVLETLPRIPLIVELKTGPAVPVVLDLLAKTGAMDRVLLASFDETSVKAIQKRGVPTVASRRQTLWFWIAARIPLLPARVPANAFSVPEFSGKTHVVDDPFLKAAREGALPVNVWTVNDPDDAVRLWTSGVCGIISNWPERMVSARTQLQAD